MADVTDPTSNPTAPDLDAIAAELSEICDRTFQRPGPDGTRSRTFHKKAHATLQATLTLPGGVPDDLAHGLFARAGTYDAWVRFSSSLFSTDGDPDARGMAVKLLGVEGATCEADVPGEQDFVMFNQPAVLFGDAERAHTYFQLLDGIGDLTKNNAVPPSFVFPSWDPRKIRWRFIGLLLDAARQTLLAPCLSELTFYTITPYRLADDAMKVSFRPIPGPKVRRKGSWRERIRQRLEAGPLRFDLRVQRRTRPETESLEDADRAWTSPFVTVGELLIPSQDFDNDAREAFGEPISFSPWHCLKAHEPLGSLNRVRRKVYRDSAARRSAVCPFDAAHLTRR